MLNFSHILDYLWLKFAMLQILRCSYISSDSISIILLKLNRLVEQRVEAHLKDLVTTGEH